MVIFFHSRCWLELKEKQDGLAKLKELLKESVISVDATDKVSRGNLLARV